MNMSPGKTRSSTQQQGAALVTSLIILLILTVLGVTAMSGSSLQELMAGNFRDQTLSFQATESALSDAERTIESWTIQPLPDDTGSNGVFNPDLFGVFEDKAFDASVWASGTVYSQAGALPVSQDPVYIIEEVDFVGSSADYRDQVKRAGVVFYRITSRGTGSSDNSVTMLQTTYGKRYQ